MPGEPQAIVQQASAALFGGEPIDAVKYRARIPSAPDPGWHVARVRYSEAVSEPFELQLDLIAELPLVGVDADDLLAADVEFEVERNGFARAFGGIINQVSMVGTDQDIRTFRVQVVPAWFYLTQHVDTRIFQDLTVPQILEELLGDLLGRYGRTLDLSKLHENYVVRDYCVQYAESAFHFASRLMEEEGISYVFRPEGDGSTSTGKEVMVLTDQEAGSPNADADEIDGTFGEYVQIVPHRASEATEETIQALEWSLPEQVSKVVMRRFNWKTASSDAPEAEQSTEARLGREREIYIPDDRRRVEDQQGNDGYEGTTADEEESPTTQRRFELITGQQQGRGRGGSNLIGLCAGGTFVLHDHIDTTIAGEKLFVTRAVHVGEVPPPRAESGGPRYNNSFECMLASVPVRPALKTRRPRIQGPQTAIVTGPPGEEIHTDKHGRIKVRFHWDRLSPADDTSSCWCRVAQTWAGPGWGTWFVPRIGMEVLVEFLDGNPDRPLVTGCVYNGANGTPYPLPDEKTKSTLKTNSSPGGEGFNELRFEDAKGCEEIFIHAQKDRNEIVLNDRTKEVGHDQREHVKNDKTIQIDGYHDETIVKDMTLAVQASRSCSITKNHDESIGGAYSQAITKTKTVTVGKSFSESVDGSKTVMVQGSFSTTCDDAMSTSVKLSTTMRSGKDTTIQTDKSLNLSATEHVNEKSGKKMNLTAGDNLSIKTDKKAAIVAADELTITVGKAKIVMKKNGDILINGAKINIKGSGDVFVKGSNIGNN